MSDRAPDRDSDRLLVGGAGVAWRETGDEIVVLDLEGSVYFGLNGTAASLWRRMTSPASRSDLIELLLTRGADRGQAVRDVDDFLAKLDSYGLLGGEVIAASGTD